MKGKHWYLVISAIVLAADQLTKLWATASLKPVGSIEVIPNLLRFSYALNRGVAFSLLADTPFDIRWILAGVSTAAAIMVAVYLVRTPAQSISLNVSLALLLAGILGNLADRVRLGEVVDFLDFHWAEQFTWPTFNIADAAICIGAGLLALEIVREGGSETSDHRVSSAASGETGIGSD
ncbi:MAG: signal peptidase II [Acidobacteria bacterium]|nr:signal peptidase II [Acidobacteriota bacterium]MCW5969979.1 signal peptidase II [Blastocatellales bacterium]